MLAFFLAATFAHADFWVSPVGSDSNAGTEAAPFLSIQAAVDAAPAAGCDIHLAEGTYYVRANTSPAQLLEITKPVRIIATGDRAKTIIDAENKRRNTWVNCEGALLAGCTIRRGYHSAWNSFGGVRVSAGVVSNCVIEANHSYHYDGAFVDGGTLTHCVVRNNTTGTNVNGQGVRISRGLVANCEIYGHTSKLDCTLASGAGVYAEGGVVTNCYIHDNCLGKAGFSSGRGTPTMDNAGTGVRILGSARVTGCVIRHNGISGSAAGVYITSGTLDNSLIVENETTNVYSSVGAAVRVAGGTVSNCTITANTGARGCEGLLQSGGTVRDCVVFGNGRWDYQQTGGTSSGVVTNNPGFADAMAGDWRLTAASPCPGAGSEATLAGFGCAFTQDRAILRGDAGGDVTFTATSAGASGEVSYAWDFGDGTTGTGAAVTHHYTPGIYSVRLVATAGGDTATSSAANCVWALPDKVYVSKTGSATYPFTTAATATADLYAALALHPLEIDVAAGTYDVSKAPIGVFEPLHLRGVDGRERVVFDAKSAQYARVLILDCADALVEGIKLYRGTTSSSWACGGGAVVFAGVLSNCWITGCSSYRAPAFFLKGSGVIADTLVSGNSCGGGDTYGAVGEMAGGLLVGSTIRDTGTINGATVRGSLYLSGASAVVSNCFLHGNDIGGTAKVNLGGGVYMEKGLVVNTVISNNTASTTGGGVHMTGGTLRNCLVAGNRLNATSGSRGGGIYQTGGSVENCTILDNTASIEGGGARQTGGSIVNSVVYYNSPDNLATSSGGTVAYTASTPLADGTGNTAAEPAYLDYANHDYRYTSLATDFIDKATALDWMAGAEDLVGNARVGGSAPDLGAIEYHPSADEPFIANFTAPETSARLSLHAVFTATISKYAAADCTFAWDFGDGQTATVAGDPATSHAYASPGAYTVTLTVTPPSGASDSPAVIARTDFITVIPSVCHVSPRGGSRFPYASWADAATDIRDALAVGSDTVLVTNGTYSLNSVLVGRNVRILSVNGPDVTILKGANGYNLVTLADAGAWLEGFTLRDASIGDWNEISGGSGLRITAGTATNCIVRNCQKYSYGCCYVGGTGRLFDSAIINNSCGANSSYGAGLVVAGNGFVSGCVVTNNASSENQGANGGGAGLFIKGGTVTNCLFAGNYMRQGNSSSGGAHIVDGLVTHCVFTNNSSLSYYGGVYLRGGVLRNCLIAGNRCTGAATGNGVGGLMLAGGLAESLTIVANESSLAGGGIRQSGGILLNSVVYANVSPLECDISGGTRTNCFSTTLMDGENCLAGDPLFTDANAGDWTLSALSSAKDAGLAQDWMAGALDLRGEPRLQGDTVDIGAYETDASAVLPLSVAFAVTATEKLASGHSRLTFEATVVGATGALTYLWRFGDAENEQWTTTDSPTCTHEYAPGAYTVALRVHDAGSGEDAPDVVRVNYAVALPDVCHVAQGEGVTSVYPYVTPATGAPGLKEALATGAGEIIVHPGTYTISETVAVGNAVTIHGATGDPADAVIFAPDKDGLRVMNVQHPGAVVSGLTLKGGRMHDVNSGSGGAVLNLVDGLVTNCVLDGGYNYYHGSVLVKGGELVDSVIRNARAGHSSQDASALSMTGGLVDRCVITGNVTSAHSDGTYGEAVSLNGGTAVLRNSLIAWNTGHRAGGVRLVSAMEFSNCTVVTNTAQASCGGVRCNGRAVTCANNIVWGNVAPENPDCDNPLAFTYSCSPLFTAGTGNIVDDPAFVSPTNGDWRLSSGSPAIDAGRWGLIGDSKAAVRAQRDLAGSSRLVRLNVDMGCLEAQSPAGTILLLR